MLVSDKYGRGTTMFRLKDGGKNIEEVWFSEELDNRMGAMVKVSDYAYGSGDNNKYWFCLDWETGKQKYKDNSIAVGAVIAANRLGCDYDKNKNQIGGKKGFISIFVHKTLIK